MVDEGSGGSNVFFYPGVGPEDLAPTVWERADGADRVLRSCLEEGMRSVAVVGITKDGRLSVWSSLASTEESIGLAMRDIYQMQTWADNAERVLGEPPMHDPTDNGA